MSFQAMTWAVNQKVGSSTGKAILLMLANYADDEGRCFPGQGKIADACECSVRTVHDWLKRFEAEGIISRMERRRPTDGYRTSDEILLALHGARRTSDVAVSPADTSGEISPAGGSPEAVSHETDDDLTGSSCRAITYQGNTRLLKLGRERARKPETKPKAAAKATKPETKTPRQALEAVLDPERAAQVVEHRKAMRAPLTVSAAKLLAGKFAEWRDPNEGADAMIVGGWRGFKANWMLDRSKRDTAAGRRDAHNPPRKSGSETACDDLDEMLAAAARGRAGVNIQDDGPMIDVQATRLR